MKFSLLCLATLAATSNAFVQPGQQHRSALQSSTATTQLKVAADVVNEEVKPRRTREVRKTTPAPTVIRKEPTCSPCDPATVVTICARHAPYAVDEPKGRPTPLISTRC